MRPEKGKYYIASNTKLVEIVVVRCLDVHSTEYKPDGKGGLHKKTTYHMQDIVILDEEDGDGYLDDWELDLDEDNYTVTEVLKEDHPEYWL